MIKAIIIGIVLLGLVLAAYALVLYVVPVDLGDRVVSVIIEPGDSFERVASRLVDSGVVRSGAMLRYPAQFRGIDRKLTPGRYDFTGENSCRSVLGKLERGDVVTIRVTIYEGAPIWRVASVLAQRLGLDSAEVVRLNADSAFLTEVGKKCLEGYLFPETYFIRWGTPVRDILKEMVAMYHTKTDSVWRQDVPNNLSREEVIILASIVEAEALVNDEKPQIASVYHNRLGRKMKLDADPTVIYGLGGLNRPLLKSDLERDSPYNTYRRRGLPPTPINSPGLDAIRSVLHPALTDYLYFVADGSGKHRFSRTNDEHNRARREIRRALPQPGS
ncbi:MAG: endolytic transglycosylase MltG [Candidatus Zixiibacteriota bacterium]